jgi:hypothetical protein
LPAAEFGFKIVSKNKKAPRETWGDVPLSFLAKDLSKKAREGCPDLRRVPITVAGPWPIFTAFPASRAYEIVEGSLCCSDVHVNRNRASARDSGRSAG